MDGKAPRSLQQQLDDARGTLEPELRERLARMPGPLPDLAAYYYCRPGRDGASPTGSRPEHRVATLSLLSSMINGGAWEAARGAAIACDLVNVQLFIHDDIIDADTMSRGRPWLTTLRAANRRSRFCP